MTQSGGNIEHMFGIELLPSVSAVTARDDTGLIDAIGESAQLEAATTARRLAAIAELYHRRLAAEHPEDRDQWQIDGWDAVAAEVSAAQRISRTRASTLIMTALTLRDELPKVAAVFADGRLDYRVVAVLVSRSGLVTDDDDMANLDTRLAARGSRLNQLCHKELVDLVDSYVVAIDILAKKPKRDINEGRHIGIGNDRQGMAELWGSLRAPDALALEARLNQLADTVCPQDPRTKEQRRADATGALAAGADRLACLCGRDDCPAATTEPAATDAVIHVFAESATLEGTAETPAYVPGYGVLIADAVRDLARTARKRPVTHPGQAPPEPQYRPSTALANFIRFRDLTCRFPNCDVPAQFCEIDHTVPWPFGPTHPSNLKLECKHHHLLKTFYIGSGGWADQQLPDGTIVWTAPTGQTYQTTPGGALFFPQLAVPTGKLILPAQLPPATPGRNLKMPLRKQTREQARHARIAYERGLNQKILDEQPPEDDEPPPF